MREIEPPIFIRSEKFKYQTQKTYLVECILRTGNKDEMKIREERVYIRIASAM